jgi:hypothetical protein
MEFMAVGEEVKQVLKEGSARAGKRVVVVPDLYHGPTRRTIFKYELNSVH